MLPRRLARRPVPLVKISSTLLSRLTLRLHLLADPRGFPLLAIWPRPQTPQRQTLSRLGATASSSLTWTATELYVFHQALTNLSKLTIFQPVPQGSKTNELRALARRQWTYFKYGTSSPSETIFAKIGENAKATWDWVMDQLSIGSEAARKKAQESKVKGHKEL